MSRMNTLVNKKIRRGERRRRKEKAFKALEALGQNIGVWVTRKVAKAHAYLKSKGRPHSKRVAALLG